MQPVFDHFEFQVFQGYAGDIHQQMVFCLGLVDIDTGTVLRLAVAFALGFIARPGRTTIVEDLIDDVLHLRCKIL